jgi:ABC-2 type transport system ATP-binding protein
VIGRGRLIADTDVQDFIDQASPPTVRVRSPQAVDLYDLLTGPEITITSVGRGVFEVAGMDADKIGDIAAAHGIALHELSPHQPSLEEAFMTLTHDSVEYPALAGVAA